MEIPLSPLISSKREKQLNAVSTGGSVALVATNTINIILQTLLSGSLAHVWGMLSGL